MTAHTLAKLLLEGPDNDVIVESDGSYNNMSVVAVEFDKSENGVIFVRLLTD